MPTKKPRGAELPLEQQLANQTLHQRRLRIEHVNSSVKRCRIVKDRIRLWKEGVRDLVMELCCALHNFHTLYGHQRHGAGDAFVIVCLECIRFLRY
jgi:hypothetical protein